MSKITLDSVASGYDLSKINNNFQTIEDELNDKVLYRNNPVGEVNTLITAIDCNDKSLYNLPEPTLSHQVATKNYVDTAPTTNAAAAAASAAAAAVSETNAAASAASAAAAVVTVSDQKIIWKGAWSGATAYVVNDAVSVSGSSYICILANTNQTPPNSIYWEVLAAQGSAGAGTGDMLAANNLSDVANAAIARTNLGIQIGADVQAYDADIPTVAASQVEMEAGTEAAIRSMSPLRVAQAIAALETTSGTITLETPIATTSGTAHGYTTIPAGTKQITVTLNGVSTNGTSVLIIQLGDSGGYEVTGYTSSAFSALSQADYTTGFGLMTGVAAASVYSGAITFTLHNSTTNIWAASGGVSASGSGNASFTSGSKTLSATLDRIQLTTVNGTDVFDGGSFNLIFES